MNDQVADPDTIALASRFAELGIPTNDRLGVLGARAALERVTRLQPPAIELAAVTDVLLPGQIGRLPARIYDPAGDPAQPIVLYLHGGGWALGSIAAADRPCRELAAASGRRVISLGYRLAPETPFPGPLQDCLAAARALIDDPGLVGATASGLAVVGDSSGGNLAAAAAIVLRDERPGSISAQVLLYPCLHPARASPFDSYVTHAQAPLMTARELEWFWDLYVPDPASAREPLAAPLLAADLSGLPTTTILLAGLDPLHDEGVAYARRLREAGVTVRVRTWEGQPHGFWWMGAALARATEATEAIAEALAPANGDDLVDATARGGRDDIAAG